MNDDLDKTIVLRREYKEKARHGRTFAVVSSGLLMWPLTDRLARTLGVDMASIYPDSMGEAAAIGALLWNLIAPIAALGALVGVLYYIRFCRKMREGNEIDELREGLR